MLCKRQVGCEEAVSRKDTKLGEGASEIQPWFESTDMSFW